MIGYLLLAIALILYYIPGKRVYSIFLYLSFLSGSNGGFGFTTNSVIGCKNVDLAFIYTVVILSSFILRKKVITYKSPISKWLFIFIVFLACSWIFSYYHYGFTLFQILQASRSFLLIASFFIFIKLSWNEIRQVISLLLIITIITSVLYILQIIVGQPIMPYTLEYNIDQSTGLVRLYNIPAFLGFFLILSFIDNKYFKGNIYWYRILFITTLVCTLGRTMIIMYILGVISALYLKGGVKKMWRYVIIMMLFFTPFIEIIENRFLENKTTNDFEQIFKGSYGSKYANDGGSMTYRFAWVYERWAYLTKRPIAEQLFGLGFISDSQPICHRMYNFKVGLINQETRQVYQLTNPDIAYGNILTRLGYLGGIIYLIFIFQLIKYLFIYRKSSSIVLTSCILLGTSILVSMSGNELSDPQLFSIYFIGCATIRNANKKDERIPIL